MPKLNTIPSNWNIIPRLIGIKHNEPQIYLEYVIEENQKIKRRRVRIPIRALTNKNNSLSAYEIAVQLSKQYSRYLEKVSISQIERIVKLIKDKKVLTKEFLKLDSKTSSKIFAFKNKSFVLNDDDDNIYNFSTPTRSLISLNSLQPPSFLRENTSFSEPNLTNILLKKNNKILGSSGSLNDIFKEKKDTNNIINVLKKKKDDELKPENLVSSEDNRYSAGIADAEKNDSTINNIEENDYSMNSFENESILNSVNDLKGQNSNNNDLSLNNYEQSFEQDLESIEEDFEEISVSELNTENDFVEGEPNEESIIQERDITKAITPNESEEEEEGEEEEDLKIEEVNEDEKKEKEENFDDILISDESRNDSKSNDENNIKNFSIVNNKRSEIIENDIEISNGNNNESHSINEDLNKVSEEELIEKKKEMDVLFKKNQIKPGDPGYQYDVQKSFIMDGDADWDDSSDSISNECCDEKEYNNSEDNVKLVDRNIEIKKWDNIDINNQKSQSSLMSSMNQFLNKNNNKDLEKDNINKLKDFDESESISEEISLKSSNSNGSDFKVDPPLIINNQINSNGIFNKQNEELFGKSNINIIETDENTKIGLKEIADNEVISNNLDRDGKEDNSISLRNNKNNNINEENNENNKEKEILANNNLNKENINNHSKNESIYSGVFTHNKNKKESDDIYSFLKMENLSGSNVSLNMEKNKKSSNVNWLKQLSLNKKDDYDDDDEDEIEEIEEIEEEEDEMEENVSKKQVIYDEKKGNIYEEIIKDNNEKVKETDIDEEIEINSEIDDIDEEIEIDSEINDIDEEIEINSEINEKSAHSYIDDKGLDIGSLIELKDINSSLHQVLNENLDNNNNNNNNKN
ncbi:hypothetical protein BCR32DRAFT_270744, partial [Anaeromyces robustus]